LQRTACHVPFKGIYLLENLVPFRWLVLVATRRYSQPLATFRKSILDEDKNMEDFIELFDSRSSFATHIVFVNNDELPEWLIQSG
jgi:hypothetical protein